MLFGWMFLAWIGFGSMNLDQMGAEKPYSFVDLGLREEERFAVDQLCFDRLDMASMQYSRFGDLDLLTEELLQFFPKVGSQSDEVNGKLAALVKRLVDDVLEITKKKSAWVCVRVFRPNTLFDQPRWHMDGRFYSGSEKCVKFAAALKGAGTLFCLVSEEERKTFLFSQKDREFLEFFLGIKTHEQPDSSQGAFFLVADPKTSAIHSEPPIREDRFFLSILPGSHAEIEELYISWGGK